MRITRKKAKRSSKKRQNKSKKWFGGSKGCYLDLILAALTEGDKKMQQILLEKDIDPALLQSDKELQDNIWFAYQQATCPSKEENDHLLKELQDLKEDQKQLLEEASRLEEGDNTKLANKISKLESDLEQKLANEKMFREKITLNEDKLNECEKEKKQVEKKVEHFAAENKDLEHQLKTEMKKGNDAYAEYLSKEKQFTEELKEKLVQLKKEHKEALKEEKSGCAEKVRTAEAQKNTEIEELTAKIEQLTQDLANLKEEQTNLERSESSPGVSLAEELEMLTTEQHEKEVKIKQIEHDILSSDDPERLKRLKEEKLALLQVLAKIQNDTFLAEQRATYQQEQLEKIKRYSAYLKQSVGFGPAVEKLFNLNKIDCSVLPNQAICENEENKNDCIYKPDIDKKTKLDYGTCQNKSHLHHSVKKKGGKRQQSSDKRQQSSDKKRVTYKRKQRL